MGATGSIRRCSLDGIGFNIFADANFSEVPGTLNEAIATSGSNVQKITKQVASVSGVVVDGSDPVAYDQMLKLQASLTSFTISYTTADGSARSGTGKINIESMETEEGRVSMSFMADTIFELIPA